MEVKIIVCNTHECEFQQMVNDFIRGRNDIIDIKYAISNGGLHSHKEYSAMIIIR